jgi:signal peptide peptidase SppA
MNYPHLAARVFGTPLMIERNKLDAILFAIGPRLGLEASPPSDEAARLYGPGDAGEPRKPYYLTEDKLAVISITGPLVKRVSGEFLSGGPTTYAEIEGEIMDAATDPAVTGILLVVDSPGGESIGVMELSDLIYQARSTKPLYAAADGYAFSAAFTLASAAERLFVAESGGVGSVGVWMMHLDFSAQNEKLGVKPTYIFAGGHKIDGNPDQPLADEARQGFQAEIDRIYEMFAGRVARNRGMSIEAVKATEAALFFGPNAVAARFADQVGTVADALAALRARIAGSDSALGGVSMETSAIAPAAEAIPPAAEVVEPAAEPELAATGAAEVPEGQQHQPSLDHAAEIAELCALAGQPGAAAAFIRAARPLEQVRSELQVRRVLEDAALRISGATLPETGSECSRPGEAPSGGSAANSPVVKAAEAIAAKHRP